MEQKIKVSPKDFFLHFGVMVAFYISAISLLILFFQIINYVFKDAVDLDYDFCLSLLRFAVASLFVVFPFFIFLSFVARKDFKKFPEKENLWIRKWIIYFILFITGIAISIDIIVLINTFLGGEITTRFVFKILSVFIVAAGVFSYYICEIRHNVNETGKMAKIATIVSSLVIIISIVCGFFVMGSPFNQRMQRIDRQRITDLQSIQWQIMNIWQQKGELPKLITEITNPLSGFMVPKDPEELQDISKKYTYEQTGKTSFKLCATFNLKVDGGTQSKFGYYSGSDYPSYPEYIGSSDSWIHNEGYYCFERNIDVKLFPSNSI